MKKVVGCRLKGVGLAILVMAVSLASNAVGETISSKELIENAKSLNGKTLSYKGEAVTAILNRGEYSWVALSDSDNAIGVWCKSSQIACIKFVGGYKMKGDVLEVEGILNRACPLHGGDLDIHADRVKVVKCGFPIEEEMHTPRIGLSIALFLIILLIIAIFKKRL